MRFKIGTKPNYFALGITFSLLSLAIYENNTNMLLLGLIPLGLNLFPIIQEINNDN